MNGPVLFDLDGTLVDTAADIGRALNTVLREEGRPTLPLAAIRPQISNGSAALIELGFGVRPGEIGFDALCSRLLSCYAETPVAASVLFPGIEDVLQGLESMFRPWGIVTNKTTRLTHPVLQSMGLSDRVACVVCGDTTAHPKPHPAPLLHACTLLGCAPRQTIYVGDARRDIEAAQAARVGRTIVALYGYTGTASGILDWGADAVADSPQALPDLLDVVL